MTFDVELGAIVITFLMAFAWIVRLESSVSHLKEKLDEMSERMEKIELSHDAFQLKILEDLTCIRESLARLEGR